MVPEVKQVVGGLHPQMILTANQLTSKRSQVDIERILVDQVLCQLVVLVLELFYVSKRLVLLLLQYHGLLNFNVNGHLEVG